MVNYQEMSRSEIGLLDLEPIVFKLTYPEEGKGWSLEKADEMVARYRQFLELALIYPDKSIVPTKDIDEVWHTHILDTAKYREDCNKIFGRPLDHFPYFGIRGEEDEKQLKNAFQEAVELLMLHFGVRLLKSQIACGTSCGESLCDNNACDTNSCTPPSIRERPRPVRIRVSST